jgi:predicted phosphate transport protein (TIGR00153 family)
MREVKVNGDKIMEKRSYAWFERRRRTKALDLAQEQITRALDTATLLNQAAQSISQGKEKEALQHITSLFKEEEEVDKLRTDVFKELSKGAALFADYREDLLHLVKRLDTLADHVKDAARCMEMLIGTPLPKEMNEKIVHMTSLLVECAQALRICIEKLSVTPADALTEAQKVEEIEHQIDEDYLKTKASFIKYGQQINVGAMVILDDLIEFIEQAADQCADTADYIIILASRD